MIKDVAVESALFVVKSQRGNGASLNLFVPLDSGVCLLSVSAWFVDRYFDLKKQ